MHAQHDGPAMTCVAHCLIVGACHGTEFITYAALVLQKTASCHKELTAGSINRESAGGMLQNSASCDLRHECRVREMKISSAVLVHYQQNKRNNAPMTETEKTCYARRECELIVAVAHRENNQNGT